MSNGYLTTLAEAKAAIGKQVEWETRGWTGETKTGTLYNVKQDQCLIDKYWEWMPGLLNLRVKE